MADSTALVRVKPSAYYSATIEAFLQSTDEHILGVMTAAGEFDLVIPQRDAWMAQLSHLRQALVGIDGTIFLEFDVPRLGSRIDAVVVSGPAIFPIEFKVGEEHYQTAHYNQAWDYALDLKNFHQGSHAAPVLPVLCATQASVADDNWKPPHHDSVYPPFRTNSLMLREALVRGQALAYGNTISGTSWGRSQYSPTPTIVEAARALWSNHSVEEISRKDATAKNLKDTSVAVERIVDEARKSGRKAIVFVTGVPGAGKTLVGLNVATKRRDKRKLTHAVFLSGNGPLVDVLREALIRDEYERKNRTERKGAIAQRVKPFIQNVHHFRDEGVRNPDDPPADHVVIFDEAQRAWNRERTSRFMRERKGISGFDQSEPEFLISYMDRHRDWAVIVCLVGGGQEINTGEAGISPWLDAVREKFPHWNVHISPDLHDSEFAAGHALEALGSSVAVATEPSLHLAVSMRSFRAENVSGFVKAVLDSEEQLAQDFLSKIKKYPIAITRNLNAAKQWIRDHARGNERYGLVASSQAMRLKPHAIDVRVSVDPVHYFLDDRCDTRSSWYLEDAATEFQTQGLELDWVCVSWDADLRRTHAGWSYHEFWGCGWRNVRKADRQRYLLNAYRVLLTRARQGMVIFVPEADPLDPTRRTEYYDPTFEYLRTLGLLEL